MPLKSCNESGKPGYKWGNSGHCYTYDPKNETSRKEAKRKAIIQGYIIEKEISQEQASLYADAYLLMEK